MRMIPGLAPFALLFAASPTFAMQAPAPHASPTPTAVTVDDRGNPHIVSTRPSPVTAIERTHWKVTRMNGRKVPRRGDYHVDFDGGRIAAKFGCNAISGTYSQAGTTLDTDALIATQMGCADAARERQGKAILDQLMTIRVTGRNALRLSNDAGSIELTRR